MGGFDISKPGGGMKPKPGQGGVANRIASFVRGKGPKHPNAKTFTDGKGNLRQIGTGKILKPAPGAKGNETSAGLNKRGR